MAGEMGSFVAGSIVGKLLLDKTGWNQSIKSVTDDEKKLVGMSDKIAEGFTRTGKVMTLIGAAILGTLGSMVKAAADEEKAFAKFEAILKSTGGVAGMTRDQFYQLSESLAKTTTFTHEEILEAEALLMTFRGLSSDVFPKTITVATDLASALGVDLHTAIMQIGKALQDPIGGMMALRRMGVSFTEDQKQVIKALVESGNAAKAQGMIIDELSRKFGGSAAAAAQTFSGQLKNLKKELGEAGESIGVSLLPMLKNMVAQVRPVVDNLRKWIDTHPELVKALAEMALKVGAVLTVLGPILIIIPKLVGAFKLMQTTVIGMSGPFVAVVAALMAVGAAADMLINKYKATLDAVMAKEVQYGNIVGRMHDVRQAAIKAEIITQKEWGDLIEKFGGNYTKVYMAIATDPAYAKLKTVMDELKGKQDDAIAKAAAQKAGNKDLGDSFDGLTTKVKTWGETLKEYGILPLKEKGARITELLGYEEKLLKMLEVGTIDSAEFGKGIRKLNDDLKALGSSTVTGILPPMRDLSDVLKLAPSQFKDIEYKAFDFAAALKGVADEAMVSENTVLKFLWNVRRDMLLTIGVVIPAWDDIKEAGTEAATETSNAFDGLYNDIATGFGDLVSNVLSGASSLKEGLQGFWDLIKQSFFRMIGEMITKWTMDFILKLGKDILSIGKTAADAVGQAVKGVTSVVSGVANFLSGGLATGIGAFLGTFLGGLLGGGPSGHAQQQAINDTKAMAISLAQIHNWMFSAGSGFGGASYEFITGHIGDWLGWIKDAINVQGSRIVDALKNMPHAQRGLVMEQPGFVMTHGTPSNPEFIIPSSRFETIPQVNVLAKQQRTNLVHKQSIVHVNINGQIITDREYVRNRLLPEIILALDSHFLKTKLQRGLGVA